MIVWVQEGKFLEFKRKAQNFTFKWWNKKRVWVIPETGTPCLFEQSKYLSVKFGWQENLPFNMYRVPISKFYFPHSKNKTDRHKNTYVHICIDI